MDVYDVMRNWSRDHYSEIWRKVQNREHLDNDDEIFARQLQDHPQYHHVWEHASQIRDPHFAVDGANPFLHIALHATVEKQILDGDPPEVHEVYHAKLRNGEDSHEIIHEIAGELAKQIFAILKSRKDFDLGDYVKKVKSLV